MRKLSARSLAGQFLVFQILGVHDAAEYVTVTPIDLRRSDMRASVVARRIPGQERPTGMAERIMKHQLKEIERDLPIWTHMRYQHRPMLVREEAKAFTYLRSWSKQFYEPEAKVGRPVD